MSIEDQRLTSPYWIERDHLEAICINKRLAIAGPAVTCQHIIDLCRFISCCEDGQGYDVPDERMRDLKRIGLVEGGRFGWYICTDEGRRIHDCEGPKP